MVSVLDPGVESWGQVAALGGRTCRARIVGRVQSSSGAPIAEVRVYLQGTEIGVLTRIDARFTLVNVPAGTRVVRAERIGYGSIQREVTVTAGGEVEANFTLELPDFEAQSPLFSQNSRSLCFDIPDSERDANPNVPGRNTGS